MRSRSGISGESGRFATTRWTIVLSARDRHDPSGREAMEALCRAYWYPLYAYVRRSGYSADDSCDLTQGFFEQFLEKDFLRLVGPEKGRFRSFLLVAMKRFLAKEWKRRHAVKRGGGVVFVPIDPTEAEQRYTVEPSDKTSAEVLFDRRWAMTLLERTFARLRSEYESGGRGAIFELLKGFLSESSEQGSYAGAAAAAGLSEGAARVAVHRLRQRFRHCFHEEVAETVRPEDADDEARRLRAILSE